MFEMRTQPTGDAAPKTFGEIKVVVLGVKYCYVPGLEYGVAHQGRGSKVTDAAVVAAANRVEMEEPTTRAEHAKKELNQLGSQHEQLREQQCQLEYILANMGIHRSNGATKGRKRVAYGA